MPTIKIHRQGALGRQPRMLLDGHPLGHTAPGHCLTASLPPGRHVLQAQLDWGKTPPLVFDTDAEEMHFTVKSAMHGWRLLFAPFYLFAPYNALVVEKQQRQPAHH
jgi:hypothetical protein